jgi:hypothetical protein
MVCLPFRGCRVAGFPEGPSGFICHGDLGIGPGFGDFLLPPWFFLLGKAVSGRSKRVARSWGFGDLHGPRDFEISWTKGFGIYPGEGI